MSNGSGAPLVFAMITTRASRAYTPVALRSFFAHTPARAIDRFILIDNDDSFDPPDDLPAGAWAIDRPPAPRGFAQNANAALNRAREHRAALCLLNNDLVFTEGWIDALLEDRPALVSPVSNAHVNHTVDGWSTRVSMDLGDYLGREAHLDELARRHRAAHQGFRRVSTVPFYCIKIPPAVYERVGPFDERFGPAGGEDRDYGVRAWLAGVPQELALGSYVLHFQGKSTWRGVETPLERDARNRQFIRAFEDKWGPALSHAFLHDDWNLLRTDPRVARWVAAEQYTPAVRHLRSHPALGPYLDRQRHARFAALCCLDDLAEDVPALDPIYDACESIWILVRDASPAGAPVSPAALGAVQALPDPARKIRVVRGCWPDETAQRNAGLRLLEESGADYGFVVDAGDRHDAAEVRAAMALARAHPQIDCWRMSRAPQTASPSHTSDRSASDTGDPAAAEPPAVFLRVGSAAFVDGRAVEARRQATMAADVAIVRAAAHPAPGP